MGPSRMTTNTDMSRRRCVTWLRRIVLALVLLVVVAMVAMCVVGMIGGALAEENLHATIFAVRLVEQFVNDNGRWPNSWNELENTPFPSAAPSPLNRETSAIRIGGAHGYDWPAESKHLQKCVRIDFDVNVDQVIAQDPMEFEAIWPLGAYYEFRDYGFVQSLQETLRKSTETPRPAHGRRAESP